MNAKKNFLSNRRKCGSDRSQKRTSARKFFERTASENEKLAGNEEKRANAGSINAPQLFEPQREKSCWSQERSASAKWGCIAEEKKKKTGRATRSAVL